MHPQFAQLLTSSMQSLGETSPALAMALALIVPAVATFTVVYIVRRVTKVSWRGYWDAV